MHSSAAAKAVHLWAKNRVCGRPVVFHHVPKCAGTSVARALRRAYLPSQATIKVEQSGMAFRAWQREHGTTAIGSPDFNEMLLLYLLHCDTRCVAAHVPFSNAAFEDFSDKYAFVTVLRDPVDRFISNYHWSKSRPQGHRTIAAPLDDYIASTEALRLGSTFVRYFCGRPAQERFDSKDIERAIVNLRRMDCVGFIDEIGRFQENLQLLTGSRLKIGRENVRSANKRRGDFIDDAIRDKIRALCTPDQEIWDAVQDLRQQPSSIAPGERRRGR